jgi:hypothetical protein
MRAARDEFWAKLTGKNMSLATLPKAKPQDKPHRNLLGINEIRVDRIVGALRRNNDFDYKFRPLKQHLHDRWVNTFMSLDRDEWSPIVLHKIGEQYYVEDGHDQVSVARATGMVFIDAEIWEYSAVPKQREVLQPVTCTEHVTSKSYAAR